MTDYYVDPVSGDDTNDGLTTGTAWATFGHAFGSTSPATAGDTIFLRGGTYAEGYTVFGDTGPQGSSGTYLTVKNYTGETPVWTSLQAIVRGRNYVRYEGLRFEPTGGVPLAIEGHSRSISGVRVISCTGENVNGLDSLEFVRLSNTGLGPGNEADAYLRIQDIWIDSCDFLDDAASQNTSTDLIQLNGNCDYFRITNNTLSGSRQISIGVAARPWHHNSTYDPDVDPDDPNPAQPDYGYISGNTVENGQRNGIYLDAAGQYIVVEDNLVTFSASRNCFQGGGEEQSENMSGGNWIIRRNKLVDGFQIAGIGAKDTSDASPTPASYFQVTDFVFAHNTLHQTRTGGVRSYTYFSPYGLRVKNNIVSEISSDSTNYMIYAPWSYMDDTGWVLDYSLFYEPTSKNWQWKGTNHSNLSEWQTASGHEANALTGDPLFVDASTYDFTLQSGSPAINAGGDLTTANGSGSSSTSLVVHDSRYFSDGFGISGVSGDTIRIGSGSGAISRTITAVDYSTHTITLDSAATWSDADPVNYDYSGVGPDMGAEEYTGNIVTISASVGVVSIAGQTATVSTTGGGSLDTIVHESFTTEAAAEGTSISSFTITKPSGTVSGDVLVASIQSRGTGILTPTGWTKVTSVSTAANGEYCSMFYLVAGESEPTSYTFDINGTSSYVDAGMSRYSGVDNTNPSDVTAATDVTIDSTTFTYASITTVTDKAMVVLGYANNVQGSDHTPPTGYTEEWEEGRAALSDDIMETAGSTGTLSGSSGGGQSFEDHATITWALRPATVGPTYTLTADTGTLSLTGNSATLVASHVLPADIGTLSLTGNSTTLVANRVLSADVGTLSLTGNSATLTKLRILSAETGSLSVTGQDAGLVASRVLSAESGAIALTGNEATFVISGGGGALTPINIFSAQNADNNNITAVDGTVTITAGHPLIVIVMLMDPDELATISSVQLDPAGNNEALTFEVQSTSDQGGQGRLRAECWYIPNPTAGSNLTIRATATDTCHGIAIGGYQVEGGDTTNPIGATGTAVGLGQTASVDVAATSANSLVLGGTGWYGTNTTVTPGPDDTERWDIVADGLSGRDFTFWGGDTPAS